MSYINDVAILFIFRYNYFLLLQVSIMLNFVIIDNMLSFCD